MDDRSMAIGRMDDQWRRTPGPAYEWLVGVGLHTPTPSVCVSTWASVTHLQTHILVKVQGPPPPESVHRTSSPAGDQEGIHEDATPSYGGGGANRQGRWLHPPSYAVLGGDVPELRQGPAVRRRDNRAVRPARHKPQAQGRGPGGPAHRGRQRGGGARKLRPCRATRRLRPSLEAADHHRTRFPRFANNAETGARTSCEEAFR